MNSFMVFSQQHRQQVREEHPGATMVEVAKILGCMWQELSQYEKDKYKDCSSCGCFCNYEEEKESCEEHEPPCKRYCCEEFYPDPGLSRECQCEEDKEEEPSCKCESYCCEEDEGSYFPSSHGTDNTTPSDGLLSTHLGLEPNEAVLPDEVQHNRPNQQTPNASDDADLSDRPTGSPPVDSAPARSPNFTITSQPTVIKPL